MERAETRVIVMFLKNTKIIKVKLVSNQQAIIAGLEFAKQTFKLIDSKIKFVIKKKEGSIVRKNNIIAIIEGKAENILIGERVALNFMSHISGIATKTNQFVKLVNKKCKISLTKKEYESFLQRIVHELIRNVYKREKFMVGTVDVLIDADRYIPNDDEIIHVISL